MPPASSPKKTDNFYEQSNNRNLGYVTPPREESPTSTALNNKINRNKKYMQWLLEVFPQLGSIFKMHKKIGEGTFSSVFMASLSNEEEQPTKLFAIKHLVPTTHPKRIQIEFSCLKLIGGQDNVVGIDLCMRENENIIFVMPFLQHRPFYEYVRDMKMEETILYIKNLLIALKRVHQFGIIHRDVKPNNFLYDRKNKRFLLVDFGLAQVCSSTSPLAKIGTFSAISPPSSSTNISSAISQKRKREDDVIEPVAKRQALQKRNVNIVMNSTVSFLQSSLNLNPNKIATTCGPESVQLSKENIVKESVTKVEQFPFKSPAKIAAQAVKVSKSPYKFTGLDLPLNHSKLQEKAPGQRRLFLDDPKQIKFQKPSPMTISNRLSTKQTSPIETKTKLIQQNLQQCCKCWNKALVCSICLLRKPQEAPRAGTPGFRPPEVLLKYPNQTTAVDIWAVGVIFLCILSGSFPFFRAPNDISALAEIITIFGDEAMKKIAKLLGRHLMCETKKPLDLKKLCCKLRQRGNLSTDISVTKCDNCIQLTHNCLCVGTPIYGNSCDIFPDSAYDLLKRLLDIDPYTRISAEDALKHPFLNLI